MPGMRHSFLRTFCLAAAALAPCTAADDLFPRAEMRDRASLDLKIADPVPYESKLAPGRTLKRIDLSFTSFEWAGEKWRHPCVVLLPDRVVSELRGAAAIIAGNGADPDGLPFRYAEAAALMGIPALATVGANPGRHYGANNENVLMSVMQKKFMETGDPRWIGFTALGKVLIRAITAMQAVPGIGATRFIVTGGSKRGVASWVAAAADDRIVGAYPEAWNMANFEAALKLQVERLGPDYGKEGGGPGSEPPGKRLASLSTPRGREYAQYLDPYLWRERIAGKQILFTAGTNDPLFPAPVDKVFLPDMPKSTRILLVPNFGHGHTAGRNFTGWRMWLAHVFANRPVPEVSLTWKRQTDRLELRASVASTNPVKAVRVWSASQERGVYLKCEWKSVPLVKNGAAYSAVVPAPAAGFTAFFVEVEDEDSRWGPGVISTGMNEALPEQPGR
jgi:PhoPQ-activated pathogenicity-related protein